MTLYVYSGVPGSGKTYHAVRDMLYNRAPTITNVRVSGVPNVAVLDLADITPMLLMAFSADYFRERPYKENHLLLVIDEAQLLFNSRTWNDGDRFSWLEFLSQHRKYGYKIVLVAQSIDMIDKQFRSLCEFDVRHTAASSISVFTRALSLVGFRLTCAKYYYYDSDVLISRDFYRIAKRIGRHYRTAQDILAPDFSGIDLAPILSQLVAPLPAMGGGKGPPGRKAAKCALAAFRRLLNYLVRE